MNLLEVLSLWIVRLSAIYHLVMGLACLVSLSSIAWLGRFLYNLKAPTELDPRFEYGLKPLGAFAVSFAALSFRAGWYAGPDELLFFKSTFAVLLLLRAWFRLRYRDLFQQAFAVSWTRSRWNCLFNLALAVTLLLSIRFP